MSQAGWHFKRRERSDEVADPIQGEFFDEVADPEERRRGPAASLVREAIQNSLDARAGTGPVNVRFYLSSEENLASERAPNWFAGLWPHLCARRSGLRNIPPEPQACRFVVVEDFGTGGLEGDPRRGTTPDDDERDDFFAFFRANGLSGKAGQEGGRWGVGKSVFNRASRINSFLALSVRNSDKVAHLIGRCFLLTHKINGTEYQPYGRFGVAQDDAFILPVEDRGTIDAFRRDFRIARELSTPGLSVVVPYADEEITFDAIRSAVVREYFWPILAGGLTVEICSADGANVRLDPETLLSCAVEEDSAGLGSELRSLIQFSIDARTTPGAGIITLRPAGDPPRWTDSLFPGDSLADLVRRYQRGELLVFRIPLSVRERGGRARDSSFQVYLRLDRGGSGYPPVYIRGGLIIPKARERRVRGHSVHALVVIDDAALSSMLGDAETPAHTDWSPDSRNFRDKYEHGAAVINFVKNAPAQILDILSRARQERDWLTLADFFPAPPLDEGLPGEDNGPDEGGEGEPPVPPQPQSRPQPYRIEHAPGGFRIVRDNPEAAPLPTMLEVRVAYDTTRGSPLARYHPADFDLAAPPTEITLKSAERVAASANRLQVRLTGEDFRIEVTGFDQNRDLYVKVDFPEGEETDAPVTEGATGAGR
ncbi:MAG TPA: hypothetical protein PLC79_00460 [Phycisphaerae bacterium]|nr:hypothetical protein [Phycisphaerae bacterium]